MGEREEKRGKNEKYISTEIKIWSAANSTSGHVNHTQETKKREREVEYRREKEKKKKEKEKRRS